MSAPGEPLVACALPAEMPAARGYARRVLGPRAAWGSEALPGDGPVIVTGTCGALRDVAPGRLVLPRAVLGAEGTRHLPAARVADALAGAAARAGLAVEAGDLVEARTVVDEAAERAELARATGASFVDLESAELARACERTGRSWAVLRVVTDSPSRPLGWLAELLGGWPDGQPPASVVLLGLARRPWHAGRLLRLAGLMRAGRRDLQTVLEGALPPLRCLDPTERGPAA